MDEIIFLSLDDVITIHARQLHLFGGQEGVIDRNVVESAAAQPAATMFGEYLHPDVTMMAAAYLFHFAAAQGFVDGNKRTAADCMVVFLAKNGYRLECEDLELYELTMDVANNRTGKTGVADWVRERLVAIS